MRLGCAATCVRYLRVDQKRALGRPGSRTVHPIRNALNEMRISTVAQIQRQSLLDSGSVFGCTIRRDYVKSPQLDLLAAHREVSARLRKPLLYPLSYGGSAAG